jgi:hypothetical protein
MIAAIAAALVLVQPVSVQAARSNPDLLQVQHRVPVHPPPCGDGWDLALNGMCYPNGYLPPQAQVARRYRHPVPCGDGADVDMRDGRCYPNGMVPPRYQQGRQYQYDEDGDEGPPPRWRY